ncbi:unnamed protein product [Owenia fusiformis]|uniref:Uncharacterized protein n=1 Tax=Owenia fusiformis TaxID=6347 RepID=A0A8J1TPF8_OWEFU|nr:unnamed protein product [Owenia fusiformis]
MAGVEDGVELKDIKKIEEVNDQPLPKKDDDDVIVEVSNPEVAEADPKDTDKFLPRETKNGTKAQPEAQRESLVLRVENKVAEFKQTHDIRTIRLVIALFLVFLVLMTLVAIVVALKVTATHKFDIHCQFNSTTNLTSCVSSPSKLQ